MSIERYNEITAVTPEQQAQLASEQLLPHKRISRAKGLVLHPIVETERDDIEAPSKGLVVFNSDTGRWEGNTADSHVELDITVVEEEIDDTPDGVIVTFSGTLANTDVLESSLVITATVSASPVVGVDDGAGNITGTGITSGTINYATGAWSVTYDTAPDDTTVITASYTYTIAAVPANWEQFAHVTELADYIPLSQKDAASGVPSLTAGSKVTQDPANATATPTASKIPIADGSGKLDGWITTPILESLTTTRGDIIRRNATVNERLALGASKTALVSDGTDAGWGYQVANVATTDVGYFIAPCGLMLMQNVQMVAGANDTRAWQFALPFRLKVARTRFFVGVAESGKFFGFGIYSDLASAAIIDTGAISLTGTGWKNTTISPAVTLEPGVYYAAWTCDSTTARVYGNSTGLQIFDDTVIQAGKAANNGAAGVLPATLGALSAISLTVAPAVLMKP